MEMARWNMIVFLFKLVFSIKLTVHRICLEKKRERRGKEEGMKEKMKKGRKIKVLDYPAPKYLGSSR